MKLYHYTKIDTLDKILKTKKIRFTRADLLEDAYDANVPNGITKDSNQYINSTYVACFTETEEEHFPLWKLYDALDGVRFKIDCSLFGEINWEENRTSLNQEVVIEYSHFGDDINPHSINFLYGPKKVSYVDYTNGITKKKFREDQNHNLTFIFPDMVFSKLKFYSFENETRFVIAPSFCIISTDLNSHKINYKLNKDKKFIDIQFNQMIEEVIFGPSVNHYCTKIKQLKADLQKHNPKIEIVNSKVSIRKK